MLEDKQSTKVVGTHKYRVGHLNGTVWSHVNRDGFRYSLPYGTEPHVKTICFSLLTYVCSSQNPRGLREKNWGNLGEVWTQPFEAQSEAW